VAAVQFMLAWHGFPSGPLDGSFGARTERALKKFERWAGLARDGVVGPEVLAALRQAPPQCPITLRSPVAVAPTDGFGPRGNRFHAGLDFPAAAGTRVRAAAPGVVTFAGPMGGGWGTAVVVSHGGGLQTLYAHLSAARVKPGRRIAAGAVVGLVGASGHATGPHLHLEVHLRGAAVDPRPALAG
jgi:murein DD-endopeptidase MepM/ murein hydrolase activator NlpD